MIQVLCNKYDARALAGKITYTDSEVRNSPKYEFALDRMFDFTMSCDRQEAIQQLVAQMEHSIKTGIATQNRDWRYVFLAAYDLCNQL